jgi:hypothetical protein
MATRRRRVKHSHNKTRTIIKALLRKTMYKNKKGKHHKTKKRYQSGGGPKASKTPNPPKTPKRAVGASGDKVEPKASRVYQRRGQGYPDLPERHIAYKKKYPTAEFDIPIDISGLEFHVSVKSVKRKTPGQKSYTIMCGDARRFLTEIGLGKDPYHMVIGIRQPHSTKPNKKEVVGCEIDLREYKHVLFGKATDEQIKYIADESHRLTEAYYHDSTTAKPLIDEFNAYLKGLESKLQLAPKKENYDKKRDPRVQASFNFVPDDPITKQFIKAFEFSSMDNSPEDGDGDGAGEAATAMAMDMSTGQSAQSLAPVKTSRRRGVSKKPLTEYFRSYNKPSSRSRLPKQESSMLPPQEFVQPSSAGPAFFSAIPPIGYAQGFPPVYHEEYTLPPIGEGKLFPTSPAFSPED